MITTSPIEYLNAILTCPLGTETKLSRLELMRRMWSRRLERAGNGMSYHQIRILTSGHLMIEDAGV